MSEIEKACLAIAIVSELLRIDEKLLAIKMIRELYGANLLDAKRLVDKLQVLKDK